MRSMGHPLLAEIGLDHTAVVRHHLRIALGDDRAVVKHEEAVDEPDHRLHGVLDDGDGHAIARKLLDHGDDVVRLAVTKAGKRLVEQQDARLAGERAGKTTLFNLLNGFLRPSTGEILLDGRDMAGSKPHALCEAGVGRTFQIMRPFMRMSISDNVVIGAYVRAESDAEAQRLAAAAIARVGLSDIAGRIASDLTTKELRLMELARALAGQPRILLLDETLAGLGHDEANEVVAVIRGLARDGITIAIIEHTMQAMVRLVDSFLVLDHGAVIVEGEPEAVTRDARVIEAYLGKKWVAYAPH